MVNFWDIIPDNLDGDVVGSKENTNPATLTTERHHFLDSAPLCLKKRKHTQLAENTEHTAMSDTGLSIADYLRTTDWMNLCDKL